MMSERDRAGAAFHEAGHAVVAWALGLSVGEIEIGIAGDDSAGRSEIGDSSHLPIEDRIAVCLAGLEAQDLFKCPTHDLAGASDFTKIIEMIEGEDEEGKILTEGESKTLQDAGAARARRLLIDHTEQVGRLVAALLKSKKINAGDFFP
jgi:hypothetical protein